MQLEAYESNIAHFVPFCTSPSLLSVTISLISFTSSLLASLYSSSIQINYLLFNKKKKIKSTITCTEYLGGCTNLIFVH